MDRVLDFGSQYNQLIARRVRELKVFSEIVPHDIRAEQVLQRGAGEETVKQAAPVATNVAPLPAGRRVAKVVYVRDRLVNSVLSKEKQ
jgi:hypothetical protein